MSSEPFHVLRTVDWFLFKDMDNTYVIPLDTSDPEYLFDADRYPQHVRRMVDKLADNQDVREALVRLLVGENA